LEKNEKGETSQLVGGILFGDTFVVHRTIGVPSRSWVVTHRPSGYIAIRGLDSRQKAEQMAQNLADSPFRWDFASPEDELFKLQRSDMKEYIDRLR